MMIPKEGKKLYLSVADETNTLFIGNACKRTLSSDAGQFSYNLCAALHLYTLLTQPLRF